MAIRHNRVKHKIARTMLLGLCASAAIVGAPRAANAWDGTRAYSAKSFLDTLGVNTHMIHAWNGSSYGNVPSVKWQLKFIGFKYVRDCFCDTTAVNALVSMYTGGGIKVDMLVNPDIYNLSIATARKYPGMIAEAEGINETDNATTTAAILNGVGIGQNYQKKLFNDINANSATAPIPVDSLTLKYSTSVALVGNISSWTDRVSTHTYPQWGGVNAEYPDYYIGVVNSMMQPLAPAKPIVITEGGYWTKPHAKGVTQTVHAKYTMNFLLDAYLRGIPRTYLYQLNDEYADPSGASMEKHFGLFNYNGTPKLAASALHNMTTVLADTGLPSATAALPYTVGNFPSTAKKLLLAKSDGSYVLVLWNDLKLWDNTKYIARTTSNVQVLLTLSKQVSSLKIYDPMVGPNPTVTKTKITGLTVTLPDHPILIAVKP